MDAQIRPDERVIPVNFQKPLGLHHQKSNPLHRAVVFAKRGQGKHFITGDLIVLHGGILSE